MVIITSNGLRDMLPGEQGCIVGCAIRCIMRMHAPQGDEMAIGVSVHNPVLPCVIIQLYDCMIDCMMIVVLTLLNI